MNLCAIFSDPDWASYNLGIFLCVDCCGIHRNLGTHISKVKGLKLDNWNSEEIQASDHYVDGGRHLSLRVSCLIKIQNIPPNRPKIIADHMIQ